MTLPFATWLIVVIAMLIVVVYSMFSTPSKTSHKHKRPKAHRFFEMGGESEEFFIPGDERIGEFDENQESSTKFKRQ